MLPRCSHSARAAHLQLGDFICIVLVGMLESESSNAEKAGQLGCARTLALAYGLRKSVAEDALGFWRRLHRFGHQLYYRLEGSLVKLRASRVHRWAGHLARSQEGLLRNALRTRCLAWWRFFQHPALPLHSRRFGRPSRWESQMENLYGEVADDNPAVHDVGCIALAQDRAQWRHLAGDLAAAQT